MERTMPNNITIQALCVTPKDSEMSTYTKGRNYGSDVKMILLGKTPDYDWEEGDKLLMQRYDEAWRKLAYL